jgi:hypothetical protein
MKKTARKLGAIIVSIVGSYCLFLSIFYLLGLADVRVDSESVGVVVLSIMTVIGVVLVWVKMRMGAWLVLIVGFLFSIFALISTAPYPLSSKIIAIMVSGGPLILGSSLMLWGLHEKRT